jgi:hypothetical protein
MRGRRARALRIKPNDLPILESVAHGRQLPSFAVDRARIVLAVAEGASIGSLAALMRCDPATIWRTSRRYEAGGLEKLFQNEPRSGRPQDISPSAARPDRGVGLHGANRTRSAHHSLVQ